MMIHILTLYLEISYACVILLCIWLIILKKEKIKALGSSSNKMLCLFGKCENYSRTYSAGVIIVFLFKEVWSQFEMILSSVSSTPSCPKQIQDK